MAMMCEYKFKFRFTLITTDRGLSNGSPFLLSNPKYFLYQLYHSVFFFRSCGRLFFCVAFPVTKSDLLFQMPDIKRLDYVNDNEYKQKPNHTLTSRTASFSFWYQYRCTSAGFPYKHFCSTDKHWIGRVRRLDILTDHIHKRQK